jgi:hypothetical protein
VVRGECLPPKNKEKWYIKHLPFTSVYITTTPLLNFVPAASVLLPSAHPILPQAENGLAPVEGRAYSGIIRVQ